MATDQIARANANPSKTFFITMLTRDIDLADCVLDLLDNSVDGISHAAVRTGTPLDENSPFAGKRVDLTLNKDLFSIVDRSGGIPLDVAQEYAFRFGRPDEAPELHDGSIGLYGIGMKRAIFKMGNIVSLKTSTGDNAFDMNLNVKDWRGDPQTQENEDGVEVLDWSFELTNVETNGTAVPVGTSITITELYEGVWRQFDNPTYVASVRRMIARDYAFILNRGLEVYLNGERIHGIMPTFRESADIAPFKHVEESNGVRIEITVGLADAPPADVSATARNAKSDTYGWYIVCNDRVVVTADKSSDTVWGIKPVPTWHPQFSGFMGVARFESDDPKLLPWKTTKRDVEASNEFYQRALPVMIRATKKIIDYTNARRAEAKRLSKIERAAPATPVSRIAASAPARLPKITMTDLVSIEYDKEGDRVRAVAEALGLIGYSPAEVGVRTFEYYYDREVSR